MLKASGDTGARLVADLTNDMVRNGVIPSDWEDSFIINIYKGKGDAQERGNYRGLKLLDHVMKGMERVIEKIIRERISIDDMEFGFMPGRGTDAIFILLLRTRNCTSHLLTLKRRLIEYQEKSSGGPCENLA